MIDQVKNIDVKIDCLRKQKAKMQTRAKPSALCVRPRKYSRMILHQSLP